MSIQKKVEELAQEVKDAPYNPFGFCEGGEVKINACREYAGILRGIIYKLDTGNPAYRSSTKIKKAHTAILRGTWKRALKENR